MKDCEFAMAWYLQTDYGVLLQCEQIESGMKCVGCGSSSTTGPSSGSRVGVVYSGLGSIISGRYSSTGSIHPALYLMGNGGSIL